MVSGSDIEKIEQALEDAAFDHDKAMALLRPQGIAEWEVMYYYQKFIK